MPEYLAPGVYIEETSFRAKSIEGVSTSTAAFLGATRSGPQVGTPELVTNFAEFERIYGGLDPLNFDDTGTSVNYAAHAVRAFFEEGGSRLYVARTFQAISNEDNGVATTSIAPPAPLDVEDSIDLSTLANAKNAAAEALEAAEAAVATATAQQTAADNAVIAAQAAANAEIETAEELAATASAADDAVTTQTEEANAAAETATSNGSADSVAAARIAAAGVLEATRIAAEARAAAEAAASNVRDLIDALVQARTRAAAAETAVTAAETARDAANERNTAAQGVVDPANLAEAQAAAIAARAAAAEAQAAVMIDEEAPPPAVDGAITLAARYPGAAGNVAITFTVRESQNVLVTVDDDTKTLRGVRPFDTLSIDGGVLVVASRHTNGEMIFTNSDGETVAPNDMDSARILTVTVTVRHPGARPQEDVWENLTFDARHRSSLQRVFGETADLRRTQALTVPIIFRVADGTTTHAIVQLIQGQTNSIQLAGGNDGNRPEAGAFVGEGADDPNLASGLIALEAIPDISIIAAPGSSKDGQNGFASNAQQISNALISHCQRMRYRIAVLDAPDAAAISDIRQWRGQFDSTHAALYYPWILTADPLTGDEITLPPSGSIAGIYARNDVQRGVHKAPANEVVTQAIRFERNLNKAHQDVLNPEGINCLRWLQGRGYRVWGARTISSDPEWKYVNLRRYFAYLERSIELGTQWAVFEPNGPKLWANVRRTIEDFLYNEFSSQRLLGDTPETSYFVRCDRSTMNQNDLDNGRLVCLIGVAPLRPAEFVIFRIGQWTADSNQ